MEVAMTHTAIRHSISAFAALALVWAFAGGPAPAQTGTRPTVKKQSVQTPKGPAKKKALQAQSRKKPYQGAADDAASSLQSSMGF
jgi:hypothetical protein